MPKNKTESGSFVAILTDGTHITGSGECSDNDSFGNHVRCALDGRQYDIVTFFYAYGPSEAQMYSRDEVLEVFYGEDMNFVGKVRAAAFQAKKLLRGHK
jgi:hypothetical protein